MSDETMGTPWRQDEFDNVLDADGDRVCLTGFSLAAGYVRENDPCRERTKRTLRAVNAYEPMREALKAVRARIVEIGGTLPGGGTPYDRAMKMCAAIPVPIETLRKAMDALRAAESPEGTR